MHILLVNLHSSENAGDHALTLEAIRQLHGHFDQPDITLAMNDPASYQEAEEAIGSFYTWMIKPGPDGLPKWRWLIGPLLLFQALVAALVWRISGRLPHLALRPEQYRLLQAYTQADVVISCAGNFLYSSGTVGLPFILAIFTMAYAWLLGKPLYSLPQSIGPLRRRWEERLVRWIAARMGLLMVREGRAWALIEQLGIDKTRSCLLPDIAFAYPKSDDQVAEALLREQLGSTFGQFPLLGITMMNWGAQNRHFQKQARYEAAIYETINTFLTETEGQVFLFAQVWGPTFGEDDRVPARRVFEKLKEHGRVYIIDQPLTPAVLKGCYGQMELLLGTRMHSNIFALSEGTPVLAIGYRTKTWGIMEMMGLQEWIVDIEETHSAHLPAQLLKAWNRRETLRAHIATTLPRIKEEAGQAVELLAKDLMARKNR